jgi:hypothetical protein
MVLSAGVGLAGCASIDELKGSVSRWLSDATDRVPKALSGDASKASKKKDQQARKPQQLQTVERLNKPPASVAEEIVTPQRADAQFTLRQPAPVRLGTPWPQAPSPGTFSR